MDKSYFAKAFNSFNNKKLGGVSNSLSYDGKYLYTIFNISESQENNIFSVVILKIDPSNGNLIWAKKWKHKYPAGGKPFTSSMTDIAYGIESHGNYLYVTGTTGENKVFLIALDKQTGNLIFQKQFELNKFKRDRGFVVRLNQNNELYITGLSGTTPFLVKISNVGSGAPKMRWVKKTQWPILHESMIWILTNTITFTFLAF